jgi:DNA-binding MarR family transcriptional regulator
MDEIHLPQWLNFQLWQLHAHASAPVIRWCEGRFGISRRQWRLVATLAQAGGVLTPSALADKAMLDRSRTSKAVSEAVEKGLMRRGQGQRPKERVCVSLSEAGWALYRELMPLVQQWQQRLLAGLPPQDLAVFHRVLAELTERARAWQGEEARPWKARQGRAAALKLAPPASKKKA